MVTVMLVTSLCWWLFWWWLIWDVGGRIIIWTTFFVMLVIFSMYFIGHQHLKLVTNTFDLQHSSPTSMLPFETHVIILNQHVVALLSDSGWSFVVIEGPNDLAQWNSQQLQVYNRCWVTFLWRKETHIYHEYSDINRGNSNINHVYRENVISPHRKVCDG